MREIKFRAWDKDTKQMWTNIGMSLEKILNNPRFESMQYTGLKDKNSQEIYEDDIVELELQNEMRSIALQTARVVWVDDQARFADFIEGPQPPFGVSISRRVIGNVWENPELLKAHII